MVTEGYIRWPPLPPTLLLDRVYTPARSVSTDFCVIFMFLCRMFEKGSKTSFFTVFRGLRRPRLGARGVGYACRADRLNRHFVGVGHISFLTYLQHRPKIANISPTYAQHSPQDGST